MRQVWFIAVLVVVIIELSYNVATTHPTDPYAPFPTNKNSGSPVPSAPQLNGGESCSTNNGCAWNPSSRQPFQSNSLNGSSSQPGYRSGSHSSSQPGYGSGSHSSSQPGYGSGSHSNSQPGYGSGSHSSSQPGYGSSGHSSSQPGYGSGSHSSSQPVRPIYPRLPGTYPASSYGQTEPHSNGPPIKGYAPFPQPNSQPGQGAGFNYPPFGTTPSSNYPAESSGFGTATRYAPFVGPGSHPDLPGNTPGQPSTYPGAGNSGYPPYQSPNNPTPNLSGYGGSGGYGGYGNQPPFPSTHGNNQHNHHNGYFPHQHHGY